MAIKVEKYELDVSAPILTVIHGEPGIGKTWLASTISRQVPTLFINVEGIMQSATEGEAGLYVVNNITTVNDLAEAAHLIRMQRSKHARENAIAEEKMASWGMPKDLKFECIVIDSISKLSDVAIEGILEKYTKGRRKDEEGLLPERILNQNDWNHITRQMKGAIDLFRNFPIDVIMTARSREIKVSDTENKLILDITPSSVANALSYSAHVIGYLDSTRSIGEICTEQKRHKCNTLCIVDNSRALTKANLPPKAPVNNILHPTIEKLFSMITECQTKE